MTEKQADGEPEQADDTPKSEPSFGFRIRAAIHKRFPRLIEHPSVAGFRAYHVTRDPEQNEKTRPPHDEFVDFRCIWAVELYTPAHMEALLSSFQKLGWDRDDSVGRDGPADWIQRLREGQYGGGWYNFGLVRRANSSNKVGIYDRVAPLPPNVEYASGELFSLTSSLTCIVMGFIFEEDFASRFDHALRTDRKTYLTPLRRGHRVIDPETQKADHINQIRADSRHLAGEWFSKHLPGLFASGLLSGEFPTCEFVALRKAKPFPVRSNDGNLPPSYLSILDMDVNLDSWFWSEMPGLKFSWPPKRTKRNHYHSILAICETEFDDKILKTWGGNNRFTQISYVDQMIKGLLSRWAILPMLAGYTKHVNAIRDSAIIRNNAGSDPLKILRSLGQHVSYNIDIAAVTSELIPYVNERSLFSREINQFKLCDAERNQDEEISISKGLAFQINEQATWLQKTDQSLRDHLSQYGSLLGATENIRLQRILTAFTILIMILTVIMVWDELKNTVFLSTILNWITK